MGRPESRRVDSILSGRPKMSTKISTLKKGRPQNKVDQNVDPKNRSTQNVNPKNKVDPG